MLLPFWIFTLPTPCTSKTCEAMESIYLGFRRCPTVEERCARSRGLLQIRALLRSRAAPTVATRSRFLAIQPLWALASTLTKRAHWRNPGGTTSKMSATNQRSLDDLMQLTQVNRDSLTPPAMMFQTWKGDSRKGLHRMNLTSLTSQWLMLQSSLSAPSLHFNHHWTPRLLDQPSPMVRNFFLDPSVIDTNAVPKCHSWFQWILLCSLCMCDVIKPFALFSYGQAISAIEIATLNFSTLVCFQTEREREKTNYACSTI